jgi:hypothetical protein
MNRSFRSTELLEHLGAMLLGLLADIRVPEKRSDRVHSGEDLELT